MKYSKEQISNELLDLLVSVQIAHKMAKTDSNKSRLFEIMWKVHNLREAIEERPIPCELQQYGTLSE